MMRRQSHLDTKLVRYARNRQRDLERQGYARALRIWMHETGRSGVGLAAEVGVAPCTAYAWVDGRAMPGEENAMALRGLGFVPPERTTR